MAGFNGDLTGLNLSAVRRS